MDEHERIILAVVNNKYFDSLFDQLRHEVAEELIEGTELTDIHGLIAEAHALKRVKNKLVEIANKVRMGG